MEFTFGVIGVVIGAVVSGFVFYRVGFVLGAGAGMKLEKGSILEQESAHRSLLGSAEVRPDPQTEYGHVPVTRVGKAPPTN